MSMDTPSSTQTPYIVQSQRLRLEPLNLDSHLQECHLLMSDPQCTQWSTRAPYTLQQTTDWLSSTTASETSHVWAIMLLPTSEQDTMNPKMIGLIAIHPNTNFPAGGLAYRSDPAYWGRGYMTEAVRLFLCMFWELEGLSLSLSRPFQISNLHPHHIHNTTDSLLKPPEFKSFNTLGAGVDPENHGSRRVLEKSGFVKGELRKEVYDRAVNRGKGGRKSDLLILWVQRPRGE
ncbi:Acyl- N-acyltransferase protein [Rutstroemia sp. NJR-2017a BVV2]|nr:Acyl- N-acyltransferase protein [Rutstroemia sp. NJR-2017a BVV2]